MVTVFPENGGCLPDKRKKKMCSNKTRLLSQLTCLILLINNTEVIHV